MSSQQHSCICIFIQLPVKRFTKNCECCVKWINVFLVGFLFIGAWISEPWIPSGQPIEGSWIFDANSKNQSGVKLLWGNYVGVRQKYHTISLSIIQKNHSVYYGACKKYFVKINFKESKTDIWDVPFFGPTLCPLTSLDRDIFIWILAFYPNRVLW